VVKDSALESYLEVVLARLSPQDTNDLLLFRVQVLKNPTLNAFAYPNGVIYIHTGMLARLENEAQLATLLAHEMTHATHRHSLKQFRNLKNQTALLATLQAGLMGIGSVGALAGSLGSIGTVAAVQGYSRDLEREADYEGFQAMRAAGYDPREAPKLFRHLQKWIKENGEHEPFFFGSHPVLQERIDNFTMLIKTLPANEDPGIKNEAVYVARVRPILLLNAGLDMDAGRYDSAKSGLAKYNRIWPDTPASYCLLGDVLAEEKLSGYYGAASKSYRRAADLDPSHARAFRSIGLLEYKQGNCAKAVDAFNRYLELQPTTIDAAYIRHYLKQCNK